MSEPYFAIITPTYKREDLLTRAYESVKKQSYHEYKHIIIDDNDTTHEVSDSFKTTLAEDSHVIFLRNGKNKGKNFSLNKAFDYLQSINFSGYIIFLDDDDWLHEEALQTIKDSLTVTSSWMVLNRGTTDGKSFTKYRTKKSSFSYLSDFLLLRNIYGDATHVLHFQKAQKCRMSTSVKNGEEWLYFSQCAQTIPSLTYVDCIATYSEGYLSQGLTKNKRTLAADLETWRLLFIESVRTRIIFSPQVFLYLMARISKLVVNRILSSVIMQRN